MMLRGFVVLRYKSASTSLFEQYNSLAKNYDNTYETCSDFFFWRCFCWVTRKPQIGIDYLIDNDHLHEDVTSIAEFLRKETTISKQKISEYFSNLRNEFSMKVLL